MEVGRVTDRILGVALYTCNQFIRKRTVQILTAVLAQIIRGYYFALLFRGLVDNEIREK